MVGLLVSLSCCVDKLTPEKAVTMFNKAIEQVESLKKLLRDCENHLKNEQELSQKREGNANAYNRRALELEVLLQERTAEILRL